jgi:hypothetical protein
MEANFRSIFHKLMAMPESKTKLTGEKKSWIRGGRIFCQRYQKTIPVVCFYLEKFVTIAKWSEFILTNVYSKSYVKWNKTYFITYFLFTHLCKDY